MAQGRAKWQGVAGRSKPPLKRSSIACRRGFDWLQNDIIPRIFAMFNGASLKYTEVKFGGRLGRAPARGRMCAMLCCQSPLSVGSWRRLAGAPKSVGSGPGTIPLGTPAAEAGTQRRIAVPLARGRSTQRGWSFGGHLS